MPFRSFQLADRSDPPLPSGGASAPSSFAAAGSAADAECSYGALKPGGGSLPRALDAQPPMPLRCAAACACVRFPVRVCPSVPPEPKCSTKFKGF